MGVVVSLKTENTFLRYCDFCATTEDKAETLIASPHGQHICDKCVDLAKEIVDSRRNGT